MPTAKKTRNKAAVPGQVLQALVPEGAKSEHRLIRCLIAEIRSVRRHTQPSISGALHRTAMASVPAALSVDELQIWSGVPELSAAG